MRLVNAALSAVLVLSAISAACSRSTSTSTPAAVSADTWADVNGKAITRTDVEKEFRRASDAPASDEETLTAKLGILDTLIIEGSSWPGPVSRICRCRTPRSTRR